LNLSPSQDEELLRWSSEALKLESRAAAQRLEWLGFREPEDGLRALDRLARPTELLAPLPINMLVALARTSDPDRGLRNLERLIEVGGSNALYARLESEPDMGLQVATVLSHSQFLADILVRNPEYLRWLFGSTGSVRNSLSCNEFRSLFKQTIRTASGREERLDAVRKVHRRELLRIGAGEILDAKPVSKSCAELASLADAVLELACVDAINALSGRFGKPLDVQGRPAHFCVICLGKQGGQELNFSSDIDLLFVFDEEGQTAPGRSKRSIHNSEFFHRVGEQLIDDLTITTTEGFLYRVDMRLRPEGSTGPLVRSLRSYWIHYEGQGQLWERQMLLKARRGAGSHEVWRRFKAMITPFVFPLEFDVGPLQEISRIKQRIEREVVDPGGAPVNLKLAPGGIRDIEFVVQALQLVNGREVPKVRSHGTLPAIRLLEAAKLLETDEAQRLSHSYEILRRIENLLQIEEGRSTHDLPSDKSWIARLMGSMSATEFELELEHLFATVRKIYDDVFHQDRNPKDDLEWLLNSEERVSDAYEFLEHRGFTEPAAARQLLAELAAGSSTQSARTTLADLLPQLLASLSKLPEPDGGLRRFRRIVAAYGAPGILYGVMRDQDKLLWLLSTVCGSSAYLADMIEHDPSLVDALIAMEDPPKSSCWRTTAKRRSSNRGTTGRFYASAATISWGSSRRKPFVRSLSMLKQFCGYFMVVHGTESSGAWANRARRAALR
jgi:glutamate-ammonia-ligase adenylyltransferase